MTTIALASESTIRRRVFRTYAFDESNVRTIGQEIATVRVRGYDATLNRVARQVGHDGRVSLRDQEVLDGITRQSRDAALGVVRTHNQDLRRYLRQQEPGLSQRELSSRARAWQNDRAGWKAEQIAKTELGNGRNQAMRDVLSRNSMTSRLHLEPQGAECPICQEAIAQGSMSEAVAFDVAPPLHPGCQHWLEAEDVNTADTAVMWLGGA